MNVILVFYFTFTGNRSPTQRTVKSLDSNVKEFQREEKNMNAHYVSQGWSI